MHLASSDTQSFFPRRKNEKKEEENQQLFRKCEERRKINEIAGDKRIGVVEKAISIVIAVECSSKRRGTSKCSCVCSSVTANKSTRCFHWCAEQWSSLSSYSFSSLLTRVPSLILSFCLCVSHSCRSITRCSSRRSILWDSEERMKQLSSAEERERRTSLGYRSNNWWVTFVNSLEGRGKSITETESSWRLARIIKERHEKSRESERKKERKSERGGKKEAG